MIKVLLLWIVSFAVGLAAMQYNGVESKDAAIAIAQAPTPTISVHYVTWLKNRESTQIAAEPGATPTPSPTPTCCVFTATIGTTCQFQPASGLYDFNVAAAVNNPCGQTQTQAANFYLEGSTDGSSFEFISRTSLQNYDFGPGLNTINESFFPQSIPEQYQYYRVRMQIYACGIYSIYSSAKPVCRTGPTPTPTPTPTMATVSGRVLTPAGLGFRNAIVSIIDPQGVRRTATTSSFGVYSFDNVTTGQFYTLTVSSKRYRFSPRVLQVDGNLTNIDFVGLE